MASRNHQETTSKKNGQLKDASSGSVFFEFFKKIEANWLKWDLGNWRKEPSLWKAALGWLFFLPRVPLLILIKIYQFTLSPDHGPLKVLYPHGYCRFHPSCSTYGFVSVKKYGLFRGIPRMIWRIIRCNPWNEGGIDQP
jgi:putative membrane protein insertion efficiency factor